MTISVVIALVIGGIAGAAVLVLQRARLAQLRERVAIASSDAVTATSVDPFLDRLSAVRMVALESVDAAESAQLQVASHLQDARRLERLRLARAAARAEEPEPTAAATGGDGSGTTGAPTPRPSGGLVIGDSVSLGAESCLDPLGYHVDSEVGRQFTTGLDHLRVHAADGLPRSVVIHLGTNGPFSSDGFSSAMALTGSERRVVWVTIALPPRSQYSFVDSLNDMIRSLAADYDNVRVADFARAAAQHPEWMASDGIHINGAGCEGFAQTVDAAVTAP